MDFYDDGITKKIKKSFHFLLLHVHRVNNELIDHFLMYGIITLDGNV